MDNQTRTVGLYVPIRKWLTIAEAAELLRVSTYTIRQWAKDGKLAGYKAGLSGRWRFRIEDVEALMCKQVS